MVVVNFNPSSRDVRIFGLLLLAFFGLMGGIVLWRPEGLLGAAAILGSAWIVSLLFNSVNRGRQLLGVLLPGMFALFGGSVVRLGVDPWRVATIAWGVGALLALWVWLAPALGRRLYVGWMLAAVPIGWTLTHLILGLIYYLVLTPIGLLMRLVGKDPMRRRLERDASSYWIERDEAASSERYFKQF
jgi:hypothetical protein